jgi:hypothetical protein
MDPIEVKFWFALIRDDQEALEKVRQEVLLRRSQSLALVPLGARKKTSDFQTRCPAHA